MSIVHTPSLYSFCSMISKFKPAVLSQAFKAHNIPPKRLLFSNSSFYQQSLCYEQPSRFKTTNYNTFLYLNSLRNCISQIRFYQNHRSQPVKKSHYDILNLPSNCSKKDIKSQFYKLSLKYHPDLIKNSKLPKQQIHNNFLKISEAYKVLSNDAQRREYDQKFHFNVSQQHSHHRNTYSTPKSTHTAYNIYNKTHVYKNSDFYSNSTSENNPNHKSSSDYSNSHSKPFSYSSRDDPTSSPQFDFVNNVKSHYYKTGHFYQHSPFRNKSNSSTYKSKTSGPHKNKFQVFNQSDFAQSMQRQTYHKDVFAARLKELFRFIFTFFAILYVCYLSTELRSAH
ncbi:hypothetical protein BB561_005866 [Smittium simulii]|uniref:J domain-containing protein n=1 Tax=Smittium simulii TaxID=133385 RepID=A0A2T9Y7X5_9FUNG|nr:hypothetical protein BB561_005866 [Smittium simulii]